MGLLDVFNSDEGRLGLGLLAAAGPSATPMSFGQRIQSAMLGQDDYKSHQQKTKLLEAQLNNYNSEIEQRKVATQKAQQLQAMVGSLFGAGGVTAPQVSPGAFTPSADGYGPTMPPSMGEQARPGSRLAGLGVDQIAALKAMGGPDLMDAYKWVKDPLKMEQGATYQDRATGKERYMPKVGEGIAPDANGVYGEAPGYGAAQASIEAKKAAAIEAAKAGLDLVQAVQPDGSTKYVTRASVVGAAQPPATEAGMRTQVAGDMGPNPAAIQREIAATQRDLSNASLDPSSRAQLTAHLGDLQRQQAAIPSGVQATPSTAQKLSAEAGGKINDSWLKTRYEPTVASGDAARDLIDTVQVTRTAMSNLGGTGWSTQAKAAGAAVLNGLGIAPKNAQMFAANAEVFQSKAMERLWSTLNEAKGPQTEGDAARASKTFAGLDKTTKANEFILDMAEAKAARDQMKAKFYQQALPIAQQKGDLAEVDREWAKRAPSIFAMPTMKAWGGGVK